MPPIVGVPAFKVWWAGPSTRICWPIRQRMSQRSRIGVPKPGHQDRHGARGQKRDHAPAPSRLMRSSSSAMTAAVAERDRPCPVDLLDRLVALAGDDDDVARVGGLERCRDRLAPVRLDDQAGRPVAARPDLRR